MPVQTAGTPSELPLVSPNSEIVPPFPSENGNDKVQMKKQLGLLEGVSIILGIIFGSGNLNYQFRCASEFGTTVLFSRTIVLHFVKCFFLFNVSIVALLMV